MLHDDDFKTEKSLLVEVKGGGDFLLLLFFKLTSSKAWRSFGVE